METALFILDENIPPSVGESLLRLGFECTTVIEALGIRTDDKVIALWAEKHRATIVTKNWRDFQKYFDRRPLEQPNNFRFAGLFCVHCAQRRLAGRISQIGHLLQSECAESCACHDTRVFLELKDDSIKFIR